MTTATRPAARRKTTKARKRPVRKASRARTAKRPVRGKTTTRSTKPRARPSRPSKTATPRRWSKRVMERSDALDPTPHVFEQRDPGRIARSLKRSAERSKRRKGTPFQSAMSMLNFYVNRGGKNLPAAQKAVLERAKDELRSLYKRPRA